MPETVEQQPVNLICYRDSEGKITQHSAVPSEWTAKELTLRVSEYNSRNIGLSAEVVTIAPGSFEAYLWKCLKEAKQCAANDIQDALDAIDAARAAIQDLTPIHIND